jgi:hypothetical protein
MEFPAGEEISKLGALSIQDRLVCMPEVKMLVHCLSLYPLEIARCETSEGAQKNAPNEEYIKIREKIEVSGSIHGRILSVSLENILLS